MPVSSLPNALSALAAFTRMAQPRPLRHFLRSTSRLTVSHPVPFTPTVTRARDAVLGSRAAAQGQLASLYREKRPGDRPTIVLGGFVPDSTEQVILAKRVLLRHGSVYYLNYSRTGFSLDLFCAQMDDLVEELNLQGARPVVFSVSFGGGLLLEWLRRARLQGRPLGLGGLILVSPVACCADIIDPALPKATTLVGRALKPYLEKNGTLSSAMVEKSRSLFIKMFAGTQNRDVLLDMMGAGDLVDLRNAVLGAINGIDFQGACERVRALDAMHDPRTLIGSGSVPLCDAPALILYTEKEESVIAESSPTRLALETGFRPYFPQGECRVVSGGSSPVQHASLIFHYVQFQPHLSSFYKELKSRKFGLAA